MTLLGLVAILSGFLIFPFAFVHRTRMRSVIFVIALLAHIFSAFVYYLYVQTASADTALYYYDPFGQYADGFGLSTTFIIFVVQSLKSVAGGTYLDHFLVFQAFGFLGIALLMRSIEEIFDSLDLTQPTWSYFLVFFPGLHFWTSAIGKDAPLFTASCLAIWAAMQVRSRYIALILAIILMLLIRPHIALIAGVAVAWTVLADRTAAPFLRVLLIVGSLAALVVAAATIRTTFDVDLTSAESVTGYLETRDNFELSDDVGNTAVLNAPYPIRLLSFLFRPFFVDAEGAFGYIASLENVFFLSIIIFLMRQSRLVVAAVKAAPFVRYALLSSVGVTLALAIDYYNVGLGLRQKTMVMPGFIIAVAAIAAVRLARQRTTEVAHLARSGAIPA